MNYRRLGGKRRRIFGSSTLWLGPDHLLLVKSNRFSERYKRFYFRDIQVILISETFFSFNRNMVDALLWAFLVVVFLLLTKSPIAFGMGAAVLLYKRFSGPYCTCHVQTAVQNELLPSLYRLRDAEKVLIEIAPLIEAAQGGNVQETLPSQPSPQQS